jgi:hypothetical protein
VQELTSRVHIGKIDCPMVSQASGSHLRSASALPVDELTETVDVGSDDRDNVDGDGTEEEEEEEDEEDDEHVDVETDDDVREAVKEEEEEEEEEG